MSKLAGVLAVATLFGIAASDARGDPAQGTVLIRIVGEVRAAEGLAGTSFRPAVSLQEIQFATGSGFIVSPAGYVLTNSHVIRSETFRVLVDGRPLVVTASVQRILVVLASDSGPERSFEAAVVADDPAVDLAILSIGGQDLPFVPLGDAGVLQRGDAVTAWGYPLGNLLNVETAEGSTTPPVSAATGSVAALRSGGAAGLPASVPYIQINAPINPGASGGPLTDRDGYVVGVVQAKLRRAEGMAFAISVDEVKRFLERTGIDAMLPVTRLTGGPAFDMPDKGIRMGVPAGFADAWPGRARIDSEASLGQVRLLVDRVPTPWDGARIERALLEGLGFGHGEFVVVGDRMRGEPPPNRLRTGLARQTGESGETRMMYALADVGDEVVVARYIAPADDLAFNFSVLRESLVSLDAVPLATRPLVAPLGLQMVPAATMVEAAAIGVVPAGTRLERSPSAGCSGLAPPAGSFVATLESDFSVRFVASWWTSDTSVADLKRACVGSGVTRGSQRVQHFGLTWAVERTVVTTARGQPALLELWAPEAKSRLALDAWLAWVAAVEAAGSSSR